MPDSREFSTAVYVGDAGPAPAAPAPLLSMADAVLMEALHGGFPLIERPFAEVGRRLALTETQVIERLHRLLARGLLSRFGPLFQIERAGGLFVLAAMAVPENDFDTVAALLQAMPEVAHNYRREHQLNMWFVVAAETPEGAQAALGRIALATALKVWAFPKEREYHVELRLPLRAAAGGEDLPLPKAPPRPGPRLRGSQRLSDFERTLVAATQSGLPVVERPYEAVGAVVGTDALTVRLTLQDMLERGLIRRIGAVPHHVRLGFTANGMSVWDVDDAQVDALGEAVGRLPGVSHCYRRPRHRPEWPYNLFAMVHGRSREAVHAQVRAIAELLGPACRSHDILFSSAVLKKTGLRLHSQGE
jgi:DNA-binding Lrp family transcriptional regulator